MIGLRYLKRILPKWNNFRLISRSYRFKTDFLRKMGEKAIRYSPIGVLFSSLVLACAEEHKEVAVDQLQELTMAELVSMLHKKPSKEFVVVIYDKFKKTKDDNKFAEELKSIIEECRKAKVHAIYTINSKDVEYLRDIVRRLKNEPEETGAQPIQKKEEKKFICYFKSKCYEEAFELLNNRSYKISDQVKEIRKLQIQTNKVDLTSHLESHMKAPFDFNKIIVVKQCQGEGECVDSFKKQIAKLIEEGMFNWKSQQFQFQLVVDYPTGLLAKSTDYFKMFQKETEKLIGKHQTKKEDLLLFRRDILGQKSEIWSSWIQGEGLNYDPQDLLLMYLRPRVNIISKYSTFTDLMWYLRTSRLKPQMTFSLNNTDIWQKKNSPQSLQVLKMLYSYYPNLNYVLVNARSVGEIFHHIYSDHKYVLFEQSPESVWKKMFLDLDKLQALDNFSKEKVFVTEFKPKIDEFIKRPTFKDQVVIQKELEISLDKLKLIKDRQILKDKGAQTKNYILRVCQQKCGRYMSGETVDELEKVLKQRLNVYWIDASCQNVGVQVGDYLLTEGKLVDLQSFLVEHPKPES